MIYVWHVFGFGSMSTYCCLTYRGPVTNVYVNKLYYNWFTWWFATCSASSHFLTWWWTFLNWTIANNYREIWIKVWYFPLKQMYLKLLSANFWPFFSHSCTMRRHQMEAVSALLALCAGISPVTGVFPAQSPVTWSFDVSLICALINGWVNNREAGDLGRHRGHYDVIVMTIVGIHLHAEIWDNLHMIDCPLSCQNCHRYCTKSML